MRGRSLIGVIIMHHARQARSAVACGGDLGERPVWRIPGPPRAATGSMSGDTHPTGSVVGLPHEPSIITISVRSHYTYPS